MAQTGFCRFLLNSKGYVKENWGSPFIVVFILLLITAAVSLSSGLSSFADAVAVYAYYILAVGVVLQLACFLKCPKKDGEAV
jgi:heme/copper-type cytochrome/quinol oxidase subunit 4